MSVEMPEPPDSNQPETVSDPSTDNRFDEQNFTGQDVLELFRLEDHPCLKEIEQFIADAKDYHTAIATCYQDGTLIDAIKKNITIAEKGKMVADKLRDLPAVLHNGGVTDEHAQYAVAQLFCAVDYDFVELLTQLCPETRSRITAVTKDEVSELVFALYDRDSYPEDTLADHDEYEAVGIGLGNVYASINNKDLTIFVEEILEQTKDQKLFAAADKILSDEQTEKDQKLFAAADKILNDDQKRDDTPLGYRLGKHVIDITKIAAGVAAGTVLARLLKRNSK